jgi:hypothetical protein
MFIAPEKVYFFMVKNNCSFDVYDIRGEFWIYSSSSARFNLIIMKKKHFKEVYGIAVGHICTYSIKGTFTRKKCFK